MGEDDSSGPRSIEVRVDEDVVGQRLDKLLVARVPNMSRARARTLTDAGKVRINGRIARKGDRVECGDCVLLEEAPEPTEFRALPDTDFPLVVLYEDTLLVAIDKPAGVPSHPLRAEERGTIANALVARYPEMAAVGYRDREPGILHRLDTNTSGVLLAARDTKTFEGLRSDLKAGKMDKRYAALCAGRVEAPLEIRVPLATDPADPRKVKPVDAYALRRGQGTPVTEVLSSDPLGAFSRIEVRARSAGRHQIRAHLASLSHPLVGDTLYGGPALSGLNRHFLHATSIDLCHPSSGQNLRVVSPLPPDLQTWLDRSAFGD